MTKPNEPEPFVSSMPYEVWEELKKNWDKKPIPIDIIVQEAQQNDTVFGELGSNFKLFSRRNKEKAIKELIALAPSKEVEIFRPLNSNSNFSVWHETPDSSFSDCLAYRLIPGWQPPEKPKELVGWDYLESITTKDSVALLLWRKSTLIFHDENGWFIRTEKGWVSVYSPPHLLGMNVNDIHAGTISSIWPMDDLYLRHGGLVLQCQEQAERIKELEKSLHVIEQIARSKLRITGSTERGNGLREIISLIPTLNPTTESEE